MPSSSSFMRFVRDITKCFFCCFVSIIMTISTFVVYRGCQIIKKIILNIVLNMLLRSAFLFMKLIYIIHHFIKCKSFFFMFFITFLLILNFLFCVYFFLLLILFCFLFILFYHFFLFLINNLFFFFIHFFLLLIIIFLRLDSFCSLFIFF